MCLLVGKYERNVTLKSRTWIKRGGLVGIWLLPECIEELIQNVKNLYSQSADFVVIGQTSNTYFKDTFNIDYVVDTKKLIAFEVVDDSTLMCECGVPMARVSRYCIENGISGYEGMINLPGTVGGAIYGNAGCYGCEISKVLKYVEILTCDGKILIVKNDELGFDFRNSVLKRGDLRGVILRGYFDISLRKSPEELREIADTNTIDRKRAQDPPAHNLGTTVNFSGLKKNLRNLVVRSLGKLLKPFHLNERQNYRMRKFVICLLYGKMRVLPYISDVRMGCFMWKDSYADQVFPAYLELMQQVYNNTSIEIEIRS